MKPMDDLMLPEPYWLEPQTFGQIDYYTEAQMREYARKAVEAERARLHPFKPALSDCLKPDPIRGWIVT